MHTAVAGCRRLRRLRGWCAPSSVSCFSCIEVYRGDVHMWQMVMQSRIIVKSFGSGPCLVSQLHLLQQRCRLEAPVRPSQVRLRRLRRVPSSFRRKRQSAIADKYRLYDKPCSLPSQYILICHRTSSLHRGLFLHATRIACQQHSSAAGADASLPFSISTESKSLLYCI